MKRAIWFLLLPVLACKPKPKPPVYHISLTDNHHSVKFTGLNYAVISEISRDSASWQTLLPVYRMPADTDLKNYQPNQPGHYVVKDSAIVFTPDTPFVKGRTYFMRCYQFGEGNTPLDYIRGRSRLGNVRYVDLVFGGE